jgi:hypothetical protein
VILSVRVRCGPPKIYPENSFLLEGSSMEIMILTANGVQKVAVSGEAVMIIVNGNVVFTEGDLAAEAANQIKHSASVGARGVSAGSVQQSTVITGNGNAVAQNGSVASVNFGNGVNMSGANVAIGATIAGRDIHQSTIIDGNGNAVVQGSVVNNGGTVHGVQIGVNRGNIRYGYTFGDDD